MAGHQPVAAAIDLGDYQTRTHTALVKHFLTLSKHRFGHHVCLHSYIWVYSSAYTHIEINHKRDLTQKLVWEESPF